MAAHQADLRAGIAIVLLGCSRTAHTPVDLQLDVLRPLPAEAERVRICVSEGPEEVFGAAAGHFAVTGLRDLEPEVAIDVLSAEDELLVSVGPFVVVGEFSEVEADVEVRGEACASPGVLPGPTEDSYVLGVRFRDE